MTTIENVAPEQIKTLRTEAAEAGDAEQVKLCDLSLVAFSLDPTGVSVEALHKCIRVIQSAEAMA